MSAWGFALITQITLCVHTLQHYKFLIHPEFYMKLADRIYQLPTQEQQDEAADKVRSGVGGWDMRWALIAWLKHTPHPSPLLLSHVHDRRPRSGIGCSRSSTPPRLVIVLGLGVDGDGS